MKLIVGLIGGILAAIGSFLPWAIAKVFGEVSQVAGIKGAGIFTLILAVLGIFFLLVGMKRRKAAIGTIIMGLLILVLCIQQMSMVKESIERSIPGVAEVHIGYGLYLTLIGGAVLLIGGIMSTIRSSAEKLS